MRPGDWFEAVGYPEISGPSPLLRYAVVRKSSAGSLPKPKVLDESDLKRNGLDSTLVAVEGNFVGMHSEQGSPVLEMQSDGHLFVARLKTGTPQLTLRPGSRLQLAGVYVQTGVQQHPPNQVESFELLLNSVADISVLSQPSWWTLKRLASVVGLLLLVLLLAAAWIGQLRRQVEQRTIQLRKEISQREHAERQHAIEAERSRIARDLHDDLGSGLSEINLLVGARQQRSGEDGNDSPLFRKIASKTRGLIAALDVIVWAVDPEDNSLQSLADYLNGFVAEFLSHSGLACRLKVPIIFPAVMLDGQVRHGLLMAVKEAINNVVRHADAHSRRTANICVFTITDNRVSEAILDAHRRNVSVRIVTDNEKAEDLGSDVERLEAAGIPVRVDRSPFHMHHKFAILDGKTLVMGSYNWTRGAARDNQENLIVTNDLRLVKPFSDTFDHLWNQLG